jgi:hypothetical protein
MQKKIVYGLIIVEVIILLIIFASQMTSPVYISNIQHSDAPSELRAAVAEVWDNYGETESKPFILKAYHDDFHSNHVQPEDYWNPHLLFYKGNFSSEELQVAAHPERSFCGHRGKQNTLTKARVLCQENGIKLDESIDEKGITKEFDPINFCGDTNQSPCCVAIFEKVEQIERPNLILNSLLPLALIILLIIQLAYLAYLRYKNRKDNSKIFLIANIPFVLFGITMLPFVLNPLAFVWGLASGGILTLLLLVFAELPLAMEIFSIIKWKDIKTKKLDKTILIFTIILLIYYLAILVIFLGSIIPHVY